MAGLTKKQISARRQRLLEELPNHGWDYVKAGIAVGYSPSYAKSRLKKYAIKDSNFCQQVTVRRCQIEAKTEDRREKRLRQLDNIIDDSTISPGIRLKAIDLQGKLCGWYNNKLALETSARQAELEELRKIEVHKLLDERYIVKQHQLPDGSTTFGVDIEDSDSHSNDGHSDIIGAV